MIKQSNLVFKDLKNLRRSTAMLSHSTSKDMITSAIDIKNVRSTKQIDITNFMEVHPLRVRTGRTRSRTSMRN